MVTPSITPTALQASCHLATTWGPPSRSRQQPRRHAKPSEWGAHPSENETVWVLRLQNTLLLFYTLWNFWVNIFLVSKEREIIEKMWSNSNTALGYGFWIGQWDSEYRNTGEPPRATEFVPVLAVVTTVAMFDVLWVSNNINIRERLFIGIGGEMQKYGIVALSHPTSTQKTFTFYL